MTQISNPIPDPTPPRSRRGLRIALIVSLTVNVVVIGVLIGGMLRGSHFPPPTAVQTDFRALWRALPDAARADLRAMSRAQGFPGERGPRLSRDERRARVERLNGAIVEMLRAEPFDSAEFAQLLGADRQRMDQRLEAAQSAFADQVAALSMAQRQQMAEAFAQTWRDHPRRFPVR